MISYILEASNVNTVSVENCLDEVVLTTLLDAWLITMLQCYTSNKQPTSYHINICRLSTRTKSNKQTDRER